MENLQGFLSGVISSGYCTLPHSPHCLDKDLGVVVFFLILSSFKKTGVKTSASWCQVGPAPHILYLYLTSQHQSLHSSTLQGTEGLHGCRIRFPTLTTLLNLGESQEEGRGPYHAQKGRQLLNFGLILSGLLFQGCVYEPEDPGMGR